MKTEVILIGKGPSASKAQDVINKHKDCDIAVLNDAGNLFDGPINYLFFTDIEQIEAARETWSRVERFFCVERLHELRKPSNKTIRDIKKFPLERVAVYPYCLIGTPHEKFSRCFEERILIWKHTCSAAYSWLVFNGYKKVILVGFDGGNNYADGVLKQTDQNYDIFKQSMQLIDELAKDQLGVETIWIT